MYDQQTVESVTRWTSLGVKLSKPLKDAIAAYEAAKYAVVAPVPFDADKLTAANAESVIHELAEQLVLGLVVEDAAARLSPLERAKQQVVSATGSRVAALARHEIPDVIDQLTPSFDAAAERYCELVNQLPEEISAESLFRAGSAAVDTYRQAEAAVSSLQAVSSWVQSVGKLLGVLPRESDYVLRILRPSHIGELTKLDDAHQLRGSASRELVALDPVFVTAARLGVEFGINTPSEASALRDELSTPQVSRVNGVAMLSR